MEEILLGTYSRDAEGRNFLILPKTRETFEERMLREAKPSGILPLATDREGEYCYDVSGKKTLSVAFERVPMNAEQIQRLVGGILQIAKRTGEYLLRTESLLLSPEYIYVDFPACEPRLCYYPEYKVPFFKQLGKLFEVFLNRVDYREDKAISMVYGLYMLLQEPDVTADEIERRLQSEVFGTEHEVSSDAGRGSLSGEESASYRTQPMGAGNYHEPVKQKGQESCKKIRKAESGLNYRGEREKKKKRSWFDTLFRKEEAACYAESPSYSAYKELPSYPGYTERPSYPGYTERTSYPAYVEETPMEWGGQHTRVLSVSGIKEEPALVSERTGASVYLKKFPFFIGSLQGYSDLVIENDSVSRFHGKLIQEEGEVLLFDLNSTNGTKVNGTVIPVQQGIRLKSGDRVTFAEETYRFFDGGKAF